MDQPDTPTEEQDFTIKDTLNYLKESGNAYMQAKVKLASLEAKEAASEGAKTAANGAALLVLALFSYMLLLATLIGAGANLLEGTLPAIEQHVGTWPIVSFGLLLLHALFIFILLDRLKSTKKKQFFTLTKAELEKDKVWLQQLKSKDKK